MLHYNAKDNQRETCIGYSEVSKQFAQKVREMSKIEQAVRLMHILHSHNIKTHITQEYETPVSLLVLMLIKE